ncbi:hypothetical protein QQF64_003254, partial [Cirrhinus molitorella]
MYSGQLSLSLPSFQNQLIRLNRAVQRSAAHTLHSSRFRSIEAKIWFQLLFGDSMATMSDENQCEEMEIDDSAQHGNLSEDFQMDTSNDQGVRGNVVTHQPSSINGPGLLSMGHDKKDLKTADTGGPLGVMTFLNAVDKTNLQPEQALSSSSSDGQQNHTFLNAQDLKTADTGGQYSSLPLGVMMFPNAVDKTNLQPEQALSSSSSGGQQNYTFLNAEDRHTADGEESQPQDIATFKIKLESKLERIEPKRWKAALQKALQTWLSGLEGKPSVLKFTLMDNHSHAEVQITPSK